jgi:hypothetical protein
MKFGCLCLELLWRTLQVIPHWHTFRAAGTEEVHMSLRTALNKPTAHTRPAIELFARR